MDCTVMVGKVVIAVTALILLLLGVAAHAQQPSQTQIAAVRTSCRSDFMANCSGVQPGGKDALDCLRQNLAKLSGSCKTAVSALTPASAPAGAAPAAAIPPAAAPSVTTAPPAAAVPPAAAKPPARPVAKLNPPAASAPPPTSAAAPMAPPAAAPAPEAPDVMVLPPREALRILRICAVDRQALCAGVPAGGGRIIACLMRNAPALSPPCKNALTMAQAR
jgi:hypothetical protein